MQLPRLTLLLLSLFLWVPTTALGADACKVVICLYGKVTGNNGGSACHDAERDFFRIIKITHRGFNPRRTADARKTFLLECEAAEPEIVSLIIGKFGRLRGG